MNYAKLCVLIALLAAGASAAQAETRYRVSKIRYENDGFYAAVARITIGDCTVRYLAHVNVNQSIAYDLGGENGVYWAGDCTDKLEAGAEVWMRISIRGGENKNCRKDDTKFYYDPDGGTVKYTTRGTTLDGNRCRIANKPSDDHILSSE
jgi:hypothetical protein